MPSPSPTTVQGSNTGIGYEAALALVTHSSDYHVIVCSRSEEKGEKAVADLRRRSIKGTVSLLQLDVTSDSSIAAAASAVTDQFGRLDVLINNAGVASTDSSTRVQLHDTFSTNVFGAMLVTEAFLPMLKQSKSQPRIIYVSSGLGSIGLKLDKSNPYSPVTANVYRMSKAAVNMLATCQHSDLQATGIKIFTICPGFVITGLGGGSADNKKAAGAGSPETSARFLLSIVQGERDADAGMFLHEGGTYPW